MRSTYWMENIDRPEDEPDFLFGKGNNHPLFKVWRRPKEPYKEIDMTEALEGAERLGREAEVKRIQKNIIENQNKRLKGDTICRNQKTSENLQRRYQNFRER